MGPQNLGAMYYTPLPLMMSQIIEAEMKNATENRMETRPEACARSRKEKLHARSRFLEARGDDLVALESDVVEGGRHPMPPRRVGGVDADNGGGGGHAHAAPGERPAHQAPPELHG